MSDGWREGKTEGRRGAIRALADHPYIETAVRVDFVPGWEGDCAFTHLELLRARAAGDRQRVQELRKEEQQLKQRADAGPEITAERMQCLLGHA